MHTTRDRRRFTPEGANHQANAPSGYQAGRNGLLIPRSFASSRTYEAANFSRNRGWRPTVAQDARKTITPAVRTTLMSHGRNLSENHGLVGGAIDDTARYTMADGIYPLPLTGDDGLDSALRADFLEWAKVADLAGVFHLFELGQMQSSTMDVDGDNFTLLTSTDPGNPAGFPKVQMLRGHRCGNGPAGEDESFFDGAKLDRSGQRVAFRILEPDGNGFTDYQAGGVLHCFEGFFPDQIRGVSAIRRGMNGMFDVHEAAGFMHNKIKQDAARATVIKNSTGQVEDDVYDDPLNAGARPDDLTWEMLTGGEIIRLGPGEEIQSESGNNPGDLFMPWSEFNFRNWSIGYGLPLEFIWKSDLGGPAQRAMLKKAQRRFNQRRSMILIPKWLQRIYLFWLSRMIVRKRYRRVPNWWKIAWQITSPDLSIDGGKDSAAAINELRAGSRSLHEDAGERGRYWLDLRAEKDLEARDLLARAKQMVKDFDIGMALAISLLQQNTPNGNVPTSAPAAKPADPIE